MPTHPSAHKLREQRSEVAGRGLVVHQPQRPLARPPQRLQLPGAQYILDIHMYIPTYESATHAQVTHVRADDRKEPPRPSKP
jgi:hypothetical protein